MHLNRFYNLFFFVKIIYKVTLIFRMTKNIIQTRTEHTRWSQNIWIGRWLGTYHHKKKYHINFRDIHVFFNNNINSVRKERPFHTKKTEWKSLHWLKLYEKLYLYYSVERWPSFQLSYSLFVTTKKKRKKKLFFMARFYITILGAKSWKVNTYSQRFCWYTFIYFSCWYSFK